MSSSRDLATSRNPDTSSLDTSSLDTATEKLNVT